MRTANKDPELSDIKNYNDTSLCKCNQFPLLRVIEVYIGFVVLEKKNLMGGYTIYGHCGHPGHVIQIPRHFSWGYIRVYMYLNIY